MTAATVLHLTTPHTSYRIGLLPTGQAAPLYYGPRLAHRKDWSDLDANDKKLMIATTRIHRLTMARLTLEMIGADFICR